MSYFLTLYISAFSVVSFFTGTMTESYPFYLNKTPAIFRITPFISVYDVIN